MARVVRRAARLAAGLALVATTGCLPAARQAFDARLAPLTPFGARASDMSLRQLLAAGAAEAAVDRLAGGPGARAAGPAAALRPTGDALLDDLLLGATAFYAGRYATSRAALAAADAAAERRLTRSLTREATALLTNDAARPYLPSRTERTLVPYYALLGFLQVGDLGAAVVEARRLAQRLEETEAEARPADRSLRAALRALTAAVFAAAGEANDAAVARRHVATLTGDSTWATDAGGPAAGDSVEVLVVVEQGFAPHRLAQVAWLDDGDTPGEGWAGRMAAVLAGAPAGGVFGVGRWDGRAWGWGAPAGRGSPWRGGGHIAWPVLARSLSVPAAPVGVVDATRDGVAGDVAAALVEEHRAALPAMLLRAAVRAGGRRALVDAAGRGRKQRGVLVAAAVLGGLAFEQADLRSWSVLPGRITVQSIRRPATAEGVTLALGGGTRRLPATRVAPGLRLAHLRLFDEGAPPLPLLPLLARWP